jgi:L-threonylcarbamoyladenylate synthase
LEALKDVAGEVRVDPGLQAEAQRPRSPGMKYRHYAPNGEMWLVAGTESDMMRTIQRLADDAAAQGRRVGILTTDERLMRYEADWVVSCGRRAEPESVARGLYAALRRFDELGADYILAETFPVEGIWFTVMNRLRKAAEGRIIHAEEDARRDG